MEYSFLNLVPSEVKRAEYDSVCAICRKTCYKGSRILNPGLQGDSFLDGWTHPACCYTKYVNVREQDEQGRIPVGDRGQLLCMVNPIYGLAENIKTPQPKYWKDTNTGTVQTASTSTQQEKKEKQMNNKMSSKDYHNWQTRAKQAIHDRVQIQEGRKMTQPEALAKFAADCRSGASTTDQAREQFDRIYDSERVAQDVRTRQRKERSSDDPFGVAS